MIGIFGTQLYQWDTGRSVKITDIEADSVHFANKGDSKAVIMEIADSQSKIPDYLLQTGKQLCVYAVKNGITVESRSFSVTARSKPENYVYEEDQRNFVYALIEAAQEATDAATQAAVGAEQAASEAQNAAERANIAAENANTAADNIIPFVVEIDGSAGESSHQAADIISVLKSGRYVYAIDTTDDPIPLVLSGARLEYSDDGILYFATFRSATREDGSWWEYTVDDDFKATGRKVSFAEINDDNVGGDAWSSRNIVDRLCPTFTKTGVIVACEPVAGYPLEVSYQFVPVQNGEPSPENPVAIQGFTEVQLTANGNVCTFQLGDTVYGGTYEVHTGILKVEWVKKTLTGGFTKSTGDGKDFACAVTPAPLYTPGSATVLCSRYRGYGWTELWTNRDKADMQGVAAGSSVIRLIDNVNFTGTSAELNAYLAENPLEIVYKIAEPYAIQLEPQQICAVAGENTLAADHGTITVTGRTMPGGGSTVELDTTLTVKGKAADAAAVGAAFGDVETALDAIIAIQNQLIGGEEE